MLLLMVKTTRYVVEVARHNETTMECLHPAHEGPSPTRQRECSTLGNDAPLKHAALRCGLHADLDGGDTVHTSEETGPSTAVLSRGSLHCTLDSCGAAACLRRALRLRFTALLACLAQDDGGWPPRVAKVLVHFDWTGRRSALNFTAGMQAGVSTLQLYSGRRQEFQVTRAGGEESCEFAHLCESSRQEAEAPRLSGTPFLFTAEAMLPPISTEDFTRSNGAGVCGALVAPPFQEWTHDTGLGERTVACLRMPEQCACTPTRSRKATPMHRPHPRHVAVPLAIVRQFDARPSAAAYWAAEDEEGFPPAATFEPGAGTPDWQPLMTWRFHTLTLAPPVRALQPPPIHHPLAHPHSQAPSTLHSLKAPLPRLPRWLQGSV